MTAAPGTPTGVLAVLLLTILTLGHPDVVAADYRGPLIDAHAHLPNAGAIEVYVEAMKRHRVVRVVLLSVGGVPRQDPAWIAAAARKHPTRVIAGLPLPYPTVETAAERLAITLGKTGARIIGEVHLRHVGRRIDRDPSDGPFARVLEVAGARGVPIVVHQDLDDGATAALERALTGHRTATIILAHAGGAAPARIDALLTAHPNLLVDLSGMHFQRTPALATEAGPLHPAWKAVIEKHPERFLFGTDVWAARAFMPAMLDRLFGWARRVLGELRPDVAQRVGYKNAAELFRVE